MLAIRRIQKGEANLFKQMRLAALLDAPYAFSSTYESASRRSAESWQEQADSTAEGADRATFFVFSDATPIGMAALYRLPDKPDAGELLQVCVPAYRGSGVAADLLGAVIRWAGQNGFRRIFAAVTQGNFRALEFYRKFGFAIAEETSGEPQEEIMLVREVETGRRPIS